MTSRYDIAKWGAAALRKAHSYTAEPKPVFEAWQHRRPDEVKIIEAIFTARHEGTFLPPAYCTVGKNGIMVKNWGKNKCTVETAESGETLKIVSVSTVGGNHLLLSNKVDEVSG